MKTNYRYPYEITFISGSWMIGELEQYIYENFIYDWSGSGWSIGNRRYNYRFWFENKNEAMLFKLVFAGT